jgi:hypothetical protein
VTDKIETTEFLTGDVRIAEKPLKTHPVDDSIVESAKTGQGLVKIESAEQFEALGRAAEAVFKAGQASAAAFLTPERAAFVRKLRVEEGYSWRSVAQACYDAWQGDWEPPSNQLVGMAICEAAAAHFGEGYMDKDWNG